MSWPYSRIWPCTRAVGTRSCIRFIARRKVDFPQPLGPIIAVTARADTSSETPLRTWLFPKKTDKFRVVTAGLVVPCSGSFCSPAAGCCRGTFGIGTGGRCACASILRTGAEAIPSQDANADIHDGHQQQQNQGAGPRLPVPIFIRRYGVTEDLQRQRC